MGGSSILQYDKDAEDYYWLTYLSTGEEVKRRIPRCTVEITDQQGKQRLYDNVYCSFQHEALFDKGNLEKNGIWILEKSTKLFIPMSNIDSIRIEPEDTPDEQPNEV